MSAPTVSLTIAHHDVTRRFSFPATQAPTWDALSSKLKERFSIEPVKTLHLKYISPDDDDLVTVSSDIELSELWSEYAQDSFPGFSFCVDVAPSQSTNATTDALLDQLKTALADDPSFARKAHKVVLKSIHKQGFHPYAGFGGHGGFGGRGGRGGFFPHGCRTGHGHRGFRFSSEETSASEESDVSETEVVPSEAGKESAPAKEDTHQHRHSGRHHHHRHGQRPRHFEFDPMSSAFRGAFGPPPPPFFGGPPGMGFGGPVPFGPHGLFAGDRRGHGRGGRGGHRHQ